MTVQIGDVMRLVRKLASLFLPSFLLLIPRISTGMDIAVEYINPFTGHSGQYATLVLRGEIKPGDYEKLFEYAAKNNVNLRANPVTLASPGGDVSEALRIGQLLKSIYASVAVGPVTGQCASACFILYVSAVDRKSVPGLVGVHRPYLSKERFQTLSPSAAETLETSALSAAESYLHKLRVPSSIVDIMFENASTEIHWLNQDELRMVGDRPAWYEEFLIARCGLDKEAEAQFLTDPDNRVVFRKLMDVVACGLQLTSQEASDNLARATAAYYRTRPAGEEERDQKRNARAATFADLDREVPNWRQINVDKAFLAWMNDGDQQSTGGTSTQALLRQAFAANERATVVAIFKEYVAQHGAVPAIPAPTPVAAAPSDPPPAFASADRWVRFAEATDTSNGFTSQSTWDLDRDSLKRGTGSQFSFDVRQTTTNDGPGAMPQLRHVVSITHWGLECAARTYVDRGGTLAYEDNGKWIPGPYEGTGHAVAASSNPRAAQIINGACAALTGQ